MATRTVTDSGSTSAPAGMRKDAAQNRARLLDAARRVFATQGTEAPLEAIAAEAGVGIATLYRRFATREDLLAVVVEEELLEYVGALESAVALPDAWRGLTSFLEQMCAIQMKHPGLCHAPYVELPNAAKVDELRVRMETLTDRLIDGTKRQVTVTFQDDEGTYEVGRPK